MSDGVFVYYSSKEFEDVINKLRSDVGYSTKKRFYVDLAKHVTFDLKSSEIKINNDQFNLFQANKAQVEAIDKLFINLTSKEKRITNDETLLESYSDIDLMIKDLHIIDSETASASELKDLHYSENGKEGLTLYSTQYTNLYIKILEQSLYQFDSQVATPKHVQLTQEHQYMIDLKKHLNNLKDFKNTEQTYKQREMKRRSVEVGDKDFIEQELTKFKTLSESEILEQQDGNKDILSALLNAVNELDKVNKNRSKAKACIGEIQQMMNCLTTLETNNKTSAMYLLNLIESIKLVGYDYEPEAEAISSKFRSNMNRLNSAITDYHSYSRSSEATKKGKYNRAAKMKYILRQVAIQNYNLVKQFQK
ncbi:conserved hypothetical protein [Vibrio crassostreae]|nr:conserved hypothetical protein [Vibrio crassostreae]